MLETLKTMKNMDDLEYLYCRNCKAHPERTPETCSIPKMGHQFKTMCSENYKPKREKEVRNSNGKI
jgi:hypothetical protein